MLLNVLAVASGILGLYLFISHFLIREESYVRIDSTYHVGCYDPDNQNNHSVLLVDKLQSIDSKVR